MKNFNAFTLNNNRSQIIEKKSKPKLIVGKIIVLFYTIITGKKISAKKIFGPLTSRLFNLKYSRINHLSPEELFELKFNINSYMKYGKVEERIQIVNDLIIQVEKLKADFYENPPNSNIDKEYLNRPKQNTSTSQQIRAKRQISEEARGKVYTHVSVFEELSDYKEWLNVILEDANSASLTKRKTKNSNSQFQLDLNVQQFASLFYFLHQEEILVIPDGKKREFAKAITSVFHTKGQKNVSVNSFINKFSKPEIEAADYWAIEFTKLKMAAKKID